MKWKHWRLKNKIAATFTLLFAVALVGLGGLTYVHTERDYTNRTLDLIHISLAQMLTTVDLYTQNTERLSLAILGDPVVQRILSKPTSDYGPQYESNEMAHRLVQFTSPWPYIQGVYLFAEDGRVFNISKGGNISNEYKVTEEPWYAAYQKQSGPFLFYWPTGPETTVIRNPQQVFSLVRSVNDFSTGHKVGYLKIDLQVQVMKSMLFSAAFAEETRDLPLRYMLLDERHHVMYDSGEEWTGKPLPPGLSRLRLGAQPGLMDREGRVVWEDTDYLFTTERSETRGWSILALAERSDVIQQSGSIRLLIVALAGVAMLIVGGAAYMLSDTIIRPLASLMKVIKRVELGDFKVRVEDNGRQDEIGRLARLFNMMLGSVDHLIHQVYLQNLREKDAQLMALQAQINPHMLFNTLNVMKALSRRNGMDDVADMAENLADLFRYSMKGWNRTVCLAEELEHVNHYIHIQQFRYGKRLKFEAAVSEELMNAQVVKLSIQPLIENAISHGIEQRVEGGAIKLSGVIRRGGLQEEDELEITVEDTGYGMPPEQVARLNAIFASDGAGFDEMPHSKSGIGLLNIHKRIRLLFGAPYGVRVSSQFGEGTVVTLLLPYSTTSKSKE